MHADETIDRLSTISATLRDCARGIEAASPALPTAEERQKLRDVARRVRVDALDALALAARLGVVFLTLLTVGCSGPGYEEAQPSVTHEVSARTPISVCIDPQLSAPDQIVRAVDFWNTALDGGVRLEPVIADDCPPGGVPIRVSGGCNGHPSCESGSLEEGDLCTRRRCCGSLGATRIAGSRVR